MHSPHDRQPLVRSAFGGDSLAHLVVENFSSATGQTVKSCFFQAAHDRFVIQSGDQMQVVNLWRRETMQLKARILRAQSTQKIFIPFDAKVRVQSALHQHPRAAQSNRLVNLCANLVDRAHVSIGRARPPIKRAERADNIADVRIVDVAIDDVSDDVVGMPSLANLIGGGADARDVIRLEQRRAVFSREPPAAQGFIEEYLHVGVRHAGCQFVNYFTLDVNTSSIKYGRRQPLAGSSCRRLSVQTGYEIPPNETSPS